MNSVSYQPGADSYRLRSSGKEQKAIKRKSQFQMLPRARLRAGKGKHFHIAKNGNYGTIPNKTGFVKNYYYAGGVNVAIVVLMQNNNIIGVSKL